MNPQIKNTLSGRYLVMGIENEEQILDFQLQIMKSNPHPQLLPLEKRKLNGKIKLYYPLGSMVSAAEYAPEGFAPEELLWILEGILRALKLSAPYLLSGHNFLLDTRFIFLEPADKNVALTCLPFRGEGDINANLQELLKALLRMAKKALSPQEALLLKSLSDAAESPLFGPEGLKKRIRDIRAQARGVPIRDSAAGKRFYLDQSLAAEVKGEPVSHREETGRKSRLGLNRRIILFLGLQAVLILLVIFALGFMQNLQHPLLLYGLAVITLTAGNIVAIDRLLLGKIPEPASPPPDWRNWLSGKLAGEHNILRREAESSTKDRA